MNLQLFSVKSGWKKPAQLGCKEPVEKISSIQRERERERERERV
jgi:hypothetical protein